MARSGPNELTACSSLVENLRGFATLGVRFLLAMLDILVRGTEEVARFRLASRACAGELDQIARLQHYQILDSSVARPVSRC